MYFDFEDSRPDIPRVGSVVSMPGGAVLSTLVHLVLGLLLLTLPRLVPRALEAVPVTPVQMTDEQRLRESARFVFVKPKIDREAPRPLERAPLSDLNRVARAPERAPRPENPAPFMRGNSAEKAERVEPEVAAGRGATPEPAENRAEVKAPTPPAPNPVENANAVKVPESQSALALPSNRPVAPAPSSRSFPGGALGDSLRNLQRYIQPENYDNSRGGAEFGNIQFDTKGVEFGPWVRRFAEQVRRNWGPLIPDAPMMQHLRGHVVVTLNIFKNGTISDVQVVQPSTIESYNSAARGALTSSNPTLPLPPEYPADRAFFTITFYYNERPPE